MLLFKTRQAISLFTTFENSHGRITPAVDELGNLKRKSLSHDRTAQSDESGTNTGVIAKG
jgi:hypothetical protein